MRRAVPAVGRLGPGNAWVAVASSVAAHALVFAGVLAVAPRSHASVPDMAASSGEVDFAVVPGGGSAGRGAPGPGAAARASGSSHAARESGASRAAAEANPSRSTRVASASTHAAPLLSSSDALRLAMLAGEEAADPSRGASPAPSRPTPSETAPAPPAAGNESAAGEAHPSAAEHGGNGGNGGTGDGGAPRAGISPEYAARLDGWFSAHVSLHGLDLPWDELRHLSARVSISLTPERQVVSYAVRGSGYGPYDERIESALRGLVSAGATLPAPPEGESVPARLTLVFRCRSQERCS